MTTIKQSAKFSRTPASLLSERNAMLQATLRDQPYDFVIAEEYPIVLAPDSDSSYALLHDNQIVSHANLWSRYLRRSSGDLIKVGLVGNVATDVRFQNQGLMARLFTELEEEAKKRHLSALILWSDLHSFYQKLGFSSLSSELRFTLKPLRGKVFNNKPGKLFLVEAGDGVDLSALLALRPNAPTLERSPEEFQKLLTIPFTHLFVWRLDQIITGYCIIGKGADMVGVVHEWGAVEPDILGCMLQHIFTISGWDELLLLSPTTLPDSYVKVLANMTMQQEKHPMAFYKSLGAENFGEEKLFIWGLDSI